VIHPYFVNDRVDRAYIFFGNIVDHTGYDTLRFTSLYTNVKCDPVEEGHTLVKSERKDIKTEDDIKRSHTITISTDKICIVAKNNNPHLDDIKNNPEEYPA